MVNISEDDFRVFEAVRESGLVNMADARAVAAVAGLELEQVRTILRNYDVLADRFLAGQQAN